MASPIYIPVDPALAPDPNGFLFDLELQFMRMVRAAQPVDQWHTRFAYMPPGASPSLKVRMPIDLTSFSFTEWKGRFEFEEGSNTHVNLTIDPFKGGTFLDVRKLRDPNAYEIHNWNGRAQQLMSAWDRHLPPKIYAMLAAGETSGVNEITGGSNYFATDHYVNRDKTGYGTFANLIGNGGALASTPIYFMLAGGSFDAMKPWAILKGAGMGDAIRAAGGRSSQVSAGDPWIVRWEANSDKELAEQNMQVRLGVYAERGYGFLFPHTCVRYEGTLDYAGLKSVVDAVRGFKDLNGYNDASSMRIEAILCEPSQVSTINGLLGREVTDSGARQVDLRIDATLQGAAVIPMSR